MAFLTTSFVFAATALMAQAAPTPVGISLAQTFAPQWRFHKDEVYFPSSVEFFLQNTDLVDASGKVIQADPTVSSVDDDANQGNGLFLSTNIEANKGGWLRGQNPSTDPSAVYTFIAPKDNGVIDLYYWLFTPFNAAKDVPLLGRVGDHVGDWERMTVRTLNNEPVSVDYHAHSDTGSTVPWAQAPKFDDNKRPVGYIARGSHGVWKDAGSHTYVNAVIFQLKDETGDGGVYWDTRDSIKPLAFPDSFSGDLDWLNYKGKWGNDGVKNCWWSWAYDECQVVAGPGGPYRPEVMGVSKARLASFDEDSSESQVVSKDSFKFKMDGILSQVLGTAVDAATSKFTIHLSEASLSQAKESSTVAVKQVCESPEEAEAEQTAITKRDIKREATSTVALTSVENLSGNSITITPAACASGTRVAAYTVGLCSSDAEDSCSFSGSERQVRAYSADASVSGPQDTVAIELEDLDNWKL